MDVAGALVLLREVGCSTDAYEGSATALSALTDELASPISPQLGDWLTNAIPAADVHLVAPWAGLRIWGAHTIGARMEGYNWNPVTESAIEDWDQQWFLIADYDADPVMVLLDGTDGDLVVHCAGHGAGAWEWEAHSPSIPRWMLEVAVTDHVMTAFPEGPGRARGFIPGADGLAWLRSALDGPLAEALPGWWPPAIEMAAPKRSRRIW
jgi:hypothetical protein